MDKAETPTEENITPFKESDAVVTDGTQDHQAGKPDPVLDQHYKTNPFFYDVANMFGIQSRDFDTAAPKVGAIVDYIVQEGAKTPEDIMLKIKELEGKVREPNFNENRYESLYRYIRLASQEQSIQKALKAFLR